MLQGFSSKSLENGRHLGPGPVTCRGPPSPMPGCCPGPWPPQVPHLGQLALGRWLGEAAEASAALQVGGGRVLKGFWYLVFVRGL